MKWEHVQATVFYFDRPVFAKFFSGAGIKLCPWNLMHAIQLIWICTSWSKDRIASIFNVTLCAMLLQTVPAACTYACTQRGLSLIHIPTTCPLVWADLNKLELVWCLIFLWKPRKYPGKARPQKKTRKLLLD